MSSSIVSDLTELIVVANAGNSSFVIQTDNVPALYVDADAKIGINTIQPAAQLEVAGENGACVRVSYKNADAHADISLTDGGDLAINPSTSGSKITTTASLDIKNHNGTTSGLMLAGELVEATAENLNSMVTTAGVASPLKALVVDSSKNISGIGAIGAETLTGTIQTAHQPNITSIGNLDSLNVTNGVSASTVTGTLQTAFQPNITTIGTLDSLSVTNGVSASTVTGTLQTAAQPNVTSVGNLSSVSIAGSNITSEAAFLSGTVAGVAARSKAVVLSSEGSIIGISSLSADTLSGTLQTAAQPNITSVGTLNNLNVTNNVSANKLTGTLQTAAQPNITTIGPLSSVSIAGSTIASEASFLSGAVAGTATNSKAVVLNSNGSVGGINSISANTLTGTIQTAAQPNITSVGSLGSVTVAGSTIASEASFLSGAVAGTAINSKVVVLSSSGSFAGISSLSATNLTGTLQTASQPNVTNVGTLSSVAVSGSATFSSTTDAISSTSGAVAISGGVGIAKSVYVGSGIYGTIETAAQPNITSLGNLDGLIIDGDLEVSGTITMNGVVVGTTSGGGATLPNYVTDITAGTAANSKALVLSSTGSINGITSLSATNLSGTLQTAAQPNITSIGALSSVSIGGYTLGSETTFLSGAVAGTAQNSKVVVLSNTGTIDGIASLSATTLSGTISTSSQPNITSIGQLSTISIAGYIIGSEAGFLSGTVSGTASNSKALVLSSSGTITGIASLSANNLIGTVRTAAQPYITSLGALSSISIAGSTIGSEAAFLSGAVAGSAANSKALILGSSGTISGITTLSATNLTGQLTTAAQPNITSLGSLNSITIAGSTIGPEAAYLSGVVAGTAGISQALVLNSAGAITGIGSLSATTLGGTLSTASQPNITRIGTLDSLVVTNGVSASSLTGTLLTAAQPNITSIGTLTSLTVSGATALTSTADATSSTTGGCLTLSGGLAVAKKLYVGSDLNVGGTINGTLGGAALSSITSVGTLGSLTVSGSLTAGTLNGTLSTGPQNGITSVGTLGSLTVSGSLTAGTLNGTLSTGPQNGITSVGTLGSLSVSGATTLTSTADATSSTAGGCLTLSGGLAVAQSVYVGTNLNVGGTINGTLGSTALSSITSVGTLTGLTVNGTINATQIYINGSPVSSGSSGSSYTSSVTPGTATASQALVVDSSVNITGINSLSTSNLITNGTASSVGGTNWVTQSGATSASWNAMCWSPDLSLFVAVGPSVIMTSPNGINWTSRSGPSYTWTSICWSPELSSFVGICNSGTQYVIYTSPDGINWTGQFFSATIFTVVCWSPDLNIFVALTKNNNQCYYSPNLTGWTGATIPNSSWVSICWSSELSMFAAVSTTGLVMTSADGLSWSSKTPSTTGVPWNSICWSPELNLFVAVSGKTTGSVASTGVMTSSDGITWTVRAAKTAEYWISVCWAPELGLFVAVSNSSTTTGIMTSSNGINWNSVTPANTNLWSAICWAPEISTLVAVAQSTVSTSAVMISTHSTTSQLSLLTNSQSQNASSLGMKADVHMKYNGGLNGSHRWLNSLSTTSSNELMRINRSGLGIGVMNPRKKLDISSSKGNCLRMRYGMTVYADLNVSSLGFLTTPNVLSINNTTAATSSTSGALLVSGGAGISGALYTGGAVSIGASIASSSVASGSLVVTGGTGISGALYVGGNSTVYGNMNSYGVISFTNSTASTSATTGALVVTGGIGVSANSYIGGITRFTSTTASTSATTGAIIVTGGIGVGGVVNIGNTTASTSATTGALIVAGGVGATGAINANGSITTTSYLGINTQSPLYPLHILNTVTAPNGYTYYAYTSAVANNVAVTNVTGASSVSAYFSGRLLCNGEVDVISDRRTKENIVDISEDTAEYFLSKITPKRFNYKSETGKSNFGYIAQDIVKAGLVELLSDHANPDMEETTDEDGFVSPAGIEFSVTTGNILPLFHLKLNQLSTENQTLQQQVDTLTAANTDLESRLAKIEALLASQSQ